MGIAEDIHAGVQSIEARLGRVEGRLEQMVASLSMVLRTDPGEGAAPNSPPVWNTTVFEFTEGQASSINLVASGAVTDEDGDPLDITYVGGLPVGQTLADYGITLTLQGGLSYDGLVAASQIAPTLAADDNINQSVEAVVVIRVNAVIPIQSDFQYIGTSISVPQGGSADLKTLLYNQTGIAPFAREYEATLAARGISLSADGIISADPASALGTAVHPIVMQVSKLDSIERIITPEIFYPAEGEITGDDVGSGASWWKIHSVSDALLPQNYAIGVFWNAVGGDYSELIASQSVAGGAGEVSIEWDITSFVQGVINETYPNDGLIFIAGSSALVQFYSKENSLGKQSPTLTIDGSPREVISDTYLRGGTPNSPDGDMYGAAEIIQVDGRNPPSRGLLYFDLSDVTSVMNATLSMLTNTTHPTTTTIGVYRISGVADKLPQNQAVPFETGIAAAYPYDSGLGAHIDVVYAEDFSDFDLGFSAANGTKMADRGWFGDKSAWNNADFRTPPLSASNVRNAKIIGDTDAEDPYYYPIAPGVRSVRCIYVAGVHNSSGPISMTWPFYGNLGSVWETFNAARGHPGYPEEPEEIWFRFYLMPGADYDPEANPDLGSSGSGGGKFFGIQSSYTWATSSFGSLTEENVPAWVSGWAGPYAINKPNKPGQGANSSQPAFGCGAWTRRGLFKGIDKNDTPFKKMGYRVWGTDAEDWAARKRYIGADWSLGWGTRSFLLKCTWNCIEHRIKMNSIDTTGTVKAYVGYPWGRRYGENPPNSSIDLLPLGSSTVGSGGCGATGTASTIVLAGNASSTDTKMVNCAVWVSSRPDEKRLITAYNGITKTATITALRDIDGNPLSSATWDNIPQTSELYTIQRNIEVRERTTLFYGNHLGSVYADQNSVPDVDHGGSLGPDTVISESPGIGNTDGLHQVWVNGRLAMNRLEDWRSIPNSQIEAITMASFMGGQNIVPMVDSTFYWALPVIAKAYIGPTGGHA